MSNQYSPKPIIIYTEIYQVQKYVRKFWTETYDYKSQESSLKTASSILWGRENMVWLLLWKCQVLIEKPWWAPLENIPEPQHISARVQFPFSKFYLIQSSTRPLSNKLMQSASLPDISQEYIKQNKHSDHIV